MWLKYCTPKRIFLPYDFMMQARYGNDLPKPASRSAISEAIRDSAMPFVSASARRNRTTVSLTCYPTLPRNGGWQHEALSLRGSRRHLDRRTAGSPSGQHHKVCSDAERDSGAVALCRIGL